MATIRAGDVLAGKYRVERVLGSGGMGFVVAARHLHLDQIVALKFIRAGTLGSDEAVKRFMREAKASARLKNEHVARVLDVGTLDTGEPYMVMEYLEGCDLAALAKARTVLPIDEASEYILQACEALSEAHALGIIHRDVKLANLFITRGPAGSPLIKVLDFGISKSSPFNATGDDCLDMTNTSAMLGSPRFMSPEQMQDARNVDGRSDIWSLGVILYRLAAGRPAFEAESLGRLFAMVMTEEVRPMREVRPGLPESFEAVVHRCLEKDPNRRFANVAELAHALVPFTANPARARGVAESIAMVLSVSPSSAAPNHPAPKPSGPLVMPAANETGTAAPWAETRAVNLVDPARARTRKYAIATAALLVASVLMLAASFRGGRGTTSAPIVRIETQHVGAHAGAAPVAPGPIAPGPVAPAPDVVPRTDFAELPPATSANPSGPPAPQQSVQAKPPTAKKNPGTKPTKPEPAPGAPAKAELPASAGIPMTRD